MTTDQLVARIKASPALAVNFRREGYSTCPCCVRRIVEFPDQQKAETVVQTIVACESRANQIQARIRELTVELQKKLDQTHEKHREAIHSLYEMFNAGY